MKRIRFSSFLVPAIVASGIFWMACTPPPPPGPTPEEMAAMAEAARLDSVAAAQEAERLRQEAEDRRLAEEEEARRLREEEEARRLAEEEARRMAILSTIYFDYDKYDLREDQGSALAENARRLREFRPEENVSVEGHADERGTVEYNLALGEKRANTVKQYLIDSGVAEGRVSTVSYGEERPADAGHTEGAWSKNRRAEMKRQ